MPRIPIQKRNLVLRLLSEGKTQREIAHLLQISRRSVNYIMKRFKDYGTVEDHKRSGRPRLLSKSMERYVILTSKRAPTWTARRIQQECRLTNKVSLDTVKRTLRRHGLFGRIAVRKPFLSARHRRIRLEWCRQRISWRMMKWEHVIFSDECKLELQPNRRLYIRRSIGNRLKAKYIHGTVKFPSSIMVWGAIRGDGSRFIVRCGKNVDSREYQRILGIAMPHIYTPSHAFQQDGAPAHRSASTKKFLHEENIRLLEPWPAQSPDLSLIENVWSFLKSKIYERKPTNIEDLWACAVEEWNSIPREQIRSLYQTIPKRLQQVISASGGHTKY